MTRYPWQRSQWQGMVERVAAGRLPHALLLAGPAGLGKAAFARQLAHALLCENPAEGLNPCDRCKSCLLFAAGTHPDLTEVGPEEGKSSIGINLIREMTQYLSLTGQYGRYRIAIISPAELLNVASANSLLKTLEEPGANTIIMLISHEPHKLLPTIRSRCQRVNFSIADRSEVVNWLRGQVDARFSAELLLDLTGNAPLRAVALAAGEQLAQRGQLWQDLVQLQTGKGSVQTVAEALVKQGSKSALQMIWSWLVDMIRFRSGQAIALLNPDMRDDLRDLSQQAELSRLHGVTEKLMNALRLADTQVNQQLLLEDILISWKAVFKPGKP